MFYFRSSYYTCRTCCLQSLENLILLSQRYCKLVLMHCHPVIVVVICLPMKHLGDLKNLLKCVRPFQIEWEFGRVGFWGQGRIKPEYPEKNLSEQGREPRTDTTFIISASRPGFEVGICLGSSLVQRAKKVVSDSLGLVDFAIGLVKSILYLPKGQVKYFEEFKL